jgi:CBS domain containing-hemolysin-like protein
MNSAPLEHVPEYTGSAGGVVDEAILDEWMTQGCATNRDLIEDIVGDIGDEAAEDAGIITETGFADDCGPASDLEGK